MATQQLINIGSSINGSPGDSLFIALTKVNDNFIELVNLDPSFKLAPVVIDNKSPDVINVLKTAFDTINNNFSNLSSLNVNLEFINIGFNQTDFTSDSLISAFTKINNNFSNLFSLLQSRSNLELIIYPAQTDLIPFSSSDYFSVVGEQEVVDIGAAPNDGTGDPLRTAFSKINNNFANLFATSTLPSTANTSGSAPGQIIFSTDAANFYQAQFSVRSTDSSANSQSVTIAAQLNDANSAVKFNVYGGTFFGNAVCRYDMDVNGSNVRITVDPLINANLNHTIFAQLMQQP